MKRENYINWDDLFIGIAQLASKRSKDPSTQCGACIVKDNRVLSIGYNGLPYGLNDDGCTYTGNLDDQNSITKEIRENDIYDYWKKPDKYEFVIHSEINAILNARCDLTNTILYIYTEKGYYPCSKCAGPIVQSGIKEVVLNFAINRNTDVYEWNYTKHIFDCANIELRVLS